ncbi:DUF2812 domain-containing protein [Anaerostipes faecalis]|uniref:DUF2812 domain-containing protein n=1 Tax=Anaerostipes faecalis TaxID=2738446 RepID=UPI003F109F65
MSEKKTELRFFSIMEYEKEAEYLKKRHEQGWKFVNVHFPGIYQFEKCEPEKVVYQLDYNQEGIKNKDEYVQMFQDCGWEYIKDFVGYSYFRKPESEMIGREEIFCDEESRLDMIKRVFRGKMVPLLIIFFGIIIPQIFMQSSINGFLSPWHVIFCLLAVIYIINFVLFTVQYANYKAKSRK